ncbi:adenylyltransferase/cytidyltransferase family protein [Candidatus Dojkabacteria bacterium]|nr:adenylyltransferase/cytidyltransferase family protein [Candidatus Dojkabacteria bacterium]
MNTDKKIIKYDDLQKLGQSYRKAEKSVVFTTGCYDILHLGHVIHFNYCKNQGDILIVSIGNDKTLRDLKGPTRPINPEGFRARMIAALELVDHVVISEEHGIMDHSRQVELLRPDVYVVPITDKYLDEKAELVESNGGVIHTCRRLPPNHKKGGISTSMIEEKLEEEKV